MNMELTQTENKSGVITAVTNCVDAMAQVSTQVTSPQELVSAIQALRSTNTKLLKRAMQLEQTLVECKKQLQTQSERSQAESQNMQKTHELTAAHEQIKLLKQELASNHQMAQQKQMIIEGLSAQLHATQERVNQTEQEWSLTQASSNQQSQQLRQAESNCQELRNRLKRQLQHNVQLKIALDKCHESTPLSDELSEGRFGYSDSENSHQVFPHAQPIPPWSTRSEATLPQDLTPQFDSQTNQTHYNLAVDEEALIATFTEQFPEAVSTLGETVEEQHDAVWELLNDSSLTTASTAQPTIEVIEIQSAATSEVETKQLNLPQLDTLSDRETEPATNIETERSVASASDQDPHDNFQQWEDTEFFIPNPNWPSPVVYPARTKKRRSAALELPKFVHS